MRNAIIILLLILLSGCSSGGSEPLVPNDDSMARVGLSEPYEENGEYFVDLIVTNIPALYQFSMRLEFDSRCIDYRDFEPSGSFGATPLKLSERVRIIPLEIKSDLRNRENDLVAIAVSRPFPEMGDIESPQIIGRVRFQFQCDLSQNPFRIFNRPDFLIFRDRHRNKIDVSPAEEPIIPGGGSR